MARVVCWGEGEKGGVLMGPVTSSCALARRRKSNAAAVAREGRYMVVCNGFFEESGGCGLWSARSGNAGTMSLSRCASQLGLCFAFQAHWNVPSKRRLRTRLHPASHLTVRMFSQECRNLRFECSTCSLKNLSRRFGWEKRQYAQTVQVGWI